MKPDSLSPVFCCPPLSHSAFKHRPKIMSSVEEANARNMLRRRAEELITVGERLGKRMIDFKAEKHSIFEKRRQGAVRAIPAVNEGRKSCRSGLPPLFVAP